MPLRVGRQPPVLRNGLASHGAGLTAPAVCDFFKVSVSWNTLHSKSKISAFARLMVIRSPWIRYVPGPLLEADAPLSLNLPPAKVILVHPALPSASAGWPPAATMSAAVGHASQT